MDPVTIALIARYAIAFGLQAGEGLWNLFKKKTVTDADVDEFFALSNKSFEQHIKGPPQPPTPT